MSIAETEDNAANNTGSVVINARAFDIAVTKSSSKATVEEGETFTYTVNVENMSSTAAGTNIVITDIVPAGLTYVGASIVGGTSNDDTNPDTTGLTWTIANLAAGANVDLTFQATVDSGAQATYGTISNTAGLTSSDQVDSNGANDTGSTTVTVIGLDLSIAKTVDNANPEEGEEVTYTLTVTNLSSQTATNISVRDIVPAGVTYVAASISGGDSNNGLDPPGAGLTWAISSMAGGTNRVLSFRATVDAGAKATYGTITNTGLILGLDQTDDQPANNSDAVDITVMGIDLAVTKSVDISSPVEGTNVVYTLTVENLSSQPATNVVITDIVPAGVTYVAASITGGTSNDDANPDTTGLTWTAASIAGGATSTFTFTASVDLGAQGLGTITNTASLSSVTETEDNPANNIDTADITPKTFDVAVVKTVNNASPEEGETVTYTVTVTNTTVGSTGTNIVITDVVPAGVTYVPASITGGDTRNDANPDTTGLTWDIGSIVGGANRVLTFDAVVDAGAKATYGTITNTASMTAVDQADSVSANNQSSVDIVVQSIDLEIVKTVSNASPEEGAGVTYTLTVNNLSSQPATNVVITDIVPAGMTYVAASIVGGTSNDDANPDTTGLTWTTASIAGGASSVFTFGATVDAGAKGTYGTITNTASITSLTETEDSLANNTDTAVVTIVGLDLALTKTVDNANPEEGETVVYTLNVANLSTQPATNVVITDIVPAGVTYVAASITGGTSNDDANPDTTGLTWTFATLGAGSSINVTFSATVDVGAKATYGTITNTVNLTSLDQSEDNAVNNTSSVDVVVKGLDLQVIKTVDVASPVEGNSVVYTVTVNNLSTQSATNVVVTDIVPAGVTYTPASITGGTSNDDANPDTTGLTWTAASIAGGGSSVFTFTASVDLGSQVAYGTVTNTASLTSVDQTEDSPGNNSDTADITIQSFNVSVAKTVNNAAPEEGETVTYTVTVTNTTAGATGTNVVITDIVPAGVTYVPASISGGDTRNDANPDTTGLTWSIGSILGGASRVLTFDAVVDTGAKATYGTVTNTAGMTAVDQADSNAADDTDTADIVIKGIDLETVKTVNNASPEEGAEVTYTVTVNNLSTQPATNVVVTDIVPAGTTYVAASIVGGTSNDDTNPDTTGLTWTTTSIAGGASAVFTFRAIVDAGAKATYGTITNTAGITSLTETEDNLANNTSAVDITVIGLDLALTKTVNSANPEEGETVVYTLNIANLSTQPATNVVITDIVPTGLTYVGASIVGGTSNDDTNPDTTGLTWTIANLA
ncbi:MAG: beta strand repeat-containing protein, partial [Bdellovibrionales bacterium]